MPSQDISHAAAASSSSTSAALSTGGGAASERRPSAVARNRSSISGSNVFANPQSTPGGTTSGTSTPVMPFSLSGNRGSVSNQGISNSGNGSGLLEFDNNGAAGR